MIDDALYAIALFPACLLFLLACWGIGAGIDWLKRRPLEKLYQTPAIEPRRRIRPR